MARLQKKLSAEAKRKKKFKADGTNGEGANGAPAGRADTAAVAARESRKKTVPATRKPADGGARTTAGIKSPNFVNQSIQFLREVKVELKKVTWPTRKQTIGSTVVVIVLVMIISLFLGVADFGLNNLIRIVLQ